MGRKRVAKSWPKHSLPEELCREILSLLPVKSLLRFRSVSKSWKALIDEPDFVRLHLARFPNNRNQSHFFAVHYNPDRSLECALRRSSDFRVTLRLGSFGAEDYNTIVGSIDGLFMLKQKFKSLTGDLLYKFVLWNRSIRKTLIISPPMLSHAQEFGLGFDPSVKDYKYVRIGHSFTEVYTVGSKSWRPVLQPSLVFDFNSHHGQLGRTVCFMGHLLAPARHIVEKNISMLVVLLFDLKMEAYATLDWPEDTDPNYKYRADGLTLADGGCSLQLISLSFRKGTVWALEGDFGRDVKSCSWVQRHTFVLTMAMERDIGHVAWGHRFLHMNQNGVIMFRADSFVICFNLETQEEKHKRKDVFHTWSYRESLIQP